MSKSLLTAKVVGGGILGTGAVAAGGYGIVEHFRSKESENSDLKEKNPSTNEQPSKPATGNAGSGEDQGSGRVSEVGGTTPSVGDSSVTTGQNGQQASGSSGGQENNTQNQGGSNPSSSSSG